MMVASGAGVLEIHDQHRACAGGMRNAFVVAGASGCCKHVMMQVAVSLLQHTCTPATQALSVSTARGEAVVCRCVDSQPWPGLPILQGRGAELGWSMINACAGVLRLSFVAASCKCLDD
jgi:hypothetical protein